MEYNFYSRYETGHRKEYIEFVTEYLKGHRVDIFAGMLSKRPLLFLMIEEWFFLFVVISSLRAFFGLRTSGLTFRAHLCISPSSYRLRIKRFILRKMKKSKFCRVLSITPFEIEPGLEDICAAYILDFQFWDKEFVISKYSKAQVESFDAQMLEAAAGRIIVSAVGKQNIDKGIDLFVNLYNDSESIRSSYCFLIGGKVDDIPAQSIEKFINLGGLVINRFISESELVSIYKASKYIWCCYSPNYNQSSGVLGRGIQFSNVVIVRDNSVSHKLCKKMNAPYLVFEDFKNGKDRCRSNEIMDDCVVLYNSHLFFNDVFASE